MLHLSNSKQLATIFLVVIVASLLGSNIMAQEPKSVILKLSENAIGNLKTAIKSENPGLRKSAIYLAGKHSVDEVTETLLKQLELEKNPSIRILITRVLYIIGNDECMGDIYRLASKDNNLRVRRMATAIYEAMRLEKSFKITDITIKNKKESQ